MSKLCSQFKRLKSRNLKSTARIKINFANKLFATKLANKACNGLLDFENYCYILN